MTHPFAALLARPDVDETVHLGSAFGLMAFHGGTLERVTDVVAVEVARRCGSSYYGVLQRSDAPVHVTSRHVDPTHSARLARFLDHIDEVVAVHGYGRDNLRSTVLVGGRHRRLAAHLATCLRRHLPDFDVVDELAAIPPELAGQHPLNPVNRVTGGGVQIELPPLLRWHVQGWHWSDDGPNGRAPQVDRLIDALSEAVDSWPGSGEPPGPPPP